jgi:hypothetical protein
VVDDLAFVEVQRRHLGGVRRLAGRRRLRELQGTLLLSALAERSRRRGSLRATASLLGLILAVAALLTFCDWLCHVEQDVLSYRDPDAGSLLPGQPTAEVFLGFLGLAAASVPLAAWIFRAQPAPGWSKSLAALAIFVALYYGTGLLQDDPMVIQSSYLLIWLALLRWIGLDIWKLVVFSVLLAVIGPVAEGIRAEDGFFWYEDVDAFNVPLWLGALYLNGAVALAALTKSVLRTSRPSV